MNGLEEQADNAKARDLFWKPLSWLGTIRPTSLRSKIPIFFPIVANTLEFSERARARGRPAALSSDANAFKVLANTYEAEMEATVRVLLEIDPTLVSRSKHVKVLLMCC